MNGRKALGIELKNAYFRQMVANVKAAAERPPGDEASLFGPERVLEAEREVP